MYFLIIFLIIFFIFLLFFSILKCLYFINISKNKSKKDSTIQSIDKYQINFNTDDTEINYENDLEKNEPFEIIACDNSWTYIPYKEFTEK